MQSAKIKINVKTHTYRVTMFHATNRGLHIIDVMEKGSSVKKEMEVSVT